MFWRRRWHISPIRTIRSFPFPARPHWGWLRSSLRAHTPDHILNDRIEFFLLLCIANSPELLKMPKRKKIYLLLQIADLHIV